MNILQQHDAGFVRTLYLNQPTQHNALNPALIAAITQAYHNVPAHIRMIVLRAHGKSFCAGADLQYMQQTRNMTAADNQADAQRLGDMFYAIYQSQVVTVAVVHGTAIGGGLGLVACCDIAIASSDAVFALTETRLGLVAAVISPYVIAKIGTSHARYGMLTGVLWRADVAAHIGLIHQVVDTPHLDAALQDVIAHVQTCGPQSIAASKHLLRHFDTACAVEDTTTRNMLAATLAHIRTSTEAQEGLEAFLNKRKALWAASDVL